ncbi:MAG: radical SAM protein, partial [Verrucomicrobia bacterium]|nr:radical SAM protein [Verrucomicrobiota bacterium]
MTRVGMISLGCAKNLVDAEIMLGHLLKAGMTIVNDASQADVVIVNTCAFIVPAKKESIRAVFDADEVRRRCHPRQALVVSGCMAQRYPDNLRQGMPEIDALMGLNEVPQIAHIVKRALAHRRAAGPRKGRQTTAAAPLSFVSGTATYIPDYDTPRFHLTPPHMAFVKIAEGCNHPCTFCVIPQMRGRHRSRPVADIVKETRRLIADGVKELNLISQDTTYYGLDLWPAKARDQRPFDHTVSRSFSQPSLLPVAAVYDRRNPTRKTNNGGHRPPLQFPTLCTLIRELDALDGDFWVRLLYTHPAHWSDEL